MRHFYKQWPMARRFVCFATVTTNRNSVTVKQYILIATGSRGESRERK